MTLIDIHIERLIRAKKGENYWAPNLVNIADGVTSSVLNHESVSRYDGLHDAGRCHAEDTRQKTKNRCVFL
jgi:hypothetical protein